MNTIASLNALDMEGLINTLSSEASASAQEDRKVTGSRVHAQSERIQEKRQERLDNLQEQLKGASKGGCLKFLVAIFKVFDILTKPLSAITGGQLKLELGKVFEQLQKSKATQRLVGLQVNGEEIQKALAGLKKFLQEDIHRMKDNEAFKTQETRQILKIIDEIQDSFRTTLRS